MANNLSAFNAQVWSKRLVKNINQINVMLPLVNKDYEGELQNVGDTVQIRTLGSISMSTYTKGQSLTYQDLAPTKEAFQISDAKYFAFEVDDIDKAQNDVNALDAYIQRAVVELNNVIEAKLLSQYSKAATANQLSNAGAAWTLTSEGTDGSSVYSVFVAARTALRKQNVPMNGLWGVVDPDSSALLFEDTKHFIRATEFGDRVVVNGTLGIQMADGTVRPGFIGRCAGFDVYETTALPNDGTDKYLMFGDNQAITYAAQLREVETLRLQTSFANAVRGLLLHDATVLAECSKRLVTVKAVI